MPVWVTLAITILNAIIQIIKLIIVLNREEPQAAKETAGALRDVRKEGDVTKLLEVFSILRKG